MILFGKRGTATASYTEQWLGSCPQYGGLPITWPSGNTSTTNLETGCPWNSSNTATDVTTDQELDKEDAGSTIVRGLKQRVALPPDTTTRATIDCYIILITQLA